jgi:hypothetical protein
LFDAEGRTNVDLLGPLSQTARGDYARFPRLGNSAGQLVEIGVRRGDIDERAEDGGHPEALTLLDVPIVQRPSMDDDERVGLRELRWNRQVDAGRLELADAAYAERCLV